MKETNEGRVTKVAPEATFAGSKVNQLGVGDTVPASCEPLVTEVTFYGVTAQVYPHPEVCSNCTLTCIFKAA